MPTKYKVGDRVRLKTSYTDTVSHLRGKTGVIVSTDTFPGGYYEIVFDDPAIEKPLSNLNWRVHDGQLEDYENGIERALKCLK